MKTINKKRWSYLFAFAFLGFTTQFGGGFASGRQIIDYFLVFGTAGLFMPILSQLLIAFVMWIACLFGFDKKLYNYRKWATEFFRPFQKILAPIYELVYNLLLVTATAIAFATGGSTLTQLIGIPYLLSTFIIAAIILMLTIFGRTMVSRAASTISILIIAGMFVVYIPNIIHLMPQISKNLTALKSDGDMIVPALVSAVVYSGFQLAAYGAYLPHIAPFQKRKDVLSGMAILCALNTIVIMMATFGMLGIWDLYSASNEVIAVPTLLLVQNGVGAKFLTPVISMLIFLGSISTAVNLIYGIVDRINTMLAKNESQEVAEAKRQKRSVAISLVYIVVTWGIAQFGLIALVSKAYGFVGYITIITFMIPVLIKGVMRWNRESESVGLEN